MALIKVSYVPVLADVNTKPLNIANKLAIRILFEMEPISIIYAQRYENKSINKNKNKIVEKWK